MKKVSVIIPCYNSQDTIKTTLQSAVNQTYKSIEIIVVDDGSKDNSKNIIESIKDNRINYYYQQNKGVSSARNKGIRLATGDYITFLDSDDVINEDKIEIQLCCLEKEKKKVCYCENEIIFTEGSKVKQSKSNNYSGKILLPYLSKKLVVTTNDWLIEAKLIKDNDIYFPEDINYGEDALFFLKVISKAEVCCVNEVLSTYVRNTDSLSHNNNFRLNNHNNYLLKYLNWIEHEQTIYSKAEINEAKERILSYCLPILFMDNLLSGSVENFDTITDYEKKVLKQFKMFSYKHSLKNSIKYRVIISSFKNKFLNKMFYKKMLLTKNRF